MISAMAHTQPLVKRSARSTTGPRSDNDGEIIAICHIWLRVSRVGELQLSSKKKEK